MQTKWRIGGIVGLLLVAGAGLILGFQGQEKVSFNRDIRPILNRHCLSCHGGVRQNGGFSLLFEADAYLPTESGVPALVPGDADASEMIRRLTEPDPELRMPYEAPPLNESDITLLRRWVDQGAQWEDHWAYQPIDVQTTVPTIRQLDWPQRELDHFVLAELEQRGFSPAAPASKPDLLRRVSLDLTGLPPAPEIARQFLEDTSTAAYERLVDTLLHLPQFGERWATMWLDFARYADSKGYEKDLNRAIWPYRDWVIRALNADMPFDQFTVEQLAGDLLPHPSESQVLATAFHRNSMANDEGGTDDEEFRVAAQLERVGTTWEVWMGTTMACVQCHSHPYDPFRHEDFYRFMAYFDNTADSDLYNEQPKLYQYADTTAERVRAIIDWVQNQTSVPLPDTFLSVQQQSLLYQLGFRRLEAEEYQAHSPLIELNIPRQESVSQIQDSSWVMYRGIELTGIDAIRFRLASASAGGFLEIHLDSLSGIPVGELRVPITKRWDNWVERTVPITSNPGHHDLYLLFREDQHFGNELFRLDWLQFIPESGPSGELLDSLERLYQFPALATPVLQELQGTDRRTTHLFERGSWLNPGPPVQSGLPQILQHALPEEPQDRLALARWIVDPRNPLTARVMVNRFWEQVFGQGLVSTLEDLGSQGSKPTHPALLDQLAQRFRTEMGWSVKALLKEMVLSATYQQATRGDSSLLAADPLNHWLGRASRPRLSAEQLRDQALAVSGLLDSTFYGPPVRVEAPVANDAYRQGELIDFDPYRRSIYTFWKRTYPVPFMIAFDGPQRNVCTSRRIRTNTPLQALSLLNDSLYFRAAEHLARAVQQDSVPVSEQIRAAYERLLFRPPSAAQRSALLALYEEGLAAYAETEHPRLSAMTLVCNAILNLDAVVVKN